MTEVTVTAGGIHLGGNLSVPGEACGLVAFVQGTRSSRFSPRSRMLATRLSQNGLATLQFDLLTPEEVAIDRRTRALRFDVEKLARRVVFVTDWLRENRATADLELGYFGSSVGAAAALMAAAHHPDRVKAVVSRGGRPDLAIEVLPKVRAATLLIVGGDDPVVEQLNQHAFAYLNCEKRIEIIPGATHSFEERGSLERVGELAANWFTAHMPVAVSS